MSTDDYQPAAPAHDRGHERAQALCGYAERPHPQLQAVRCVSQAIRPRRPRLEDIRRFQLHLSETGDKHLQSQPHHDRAAVLVPRDAAALGPCRRDLSHP